MKIIRTDCELECPLIDRTLREAGHELVLLPDGIGEDRFAEEARKIHHGEAESRSIRGETSADEAAKVHEEGVEFGVLPLLPEDHN